MAAITICSDFGAPKIKSATASTVSPSTCHEVERLLLNDAKTSGFLVSGGEEFNLGPETRLDCSELLWNKVLLKYIGDRESF